MQKLADEKKAEALQKINAMPPPVEMDLKRHPEGYHGCGGRGNQSSNLTRRDPQQKQVSEQCSGEKRWVSFLSKKKKSQGQKNLSER